MPPKVIAPADVLVEVAVTLARGVLPPMFPEKVTVPKPAVVVSAKAPLMVPPKEMLFPFEVITDAAVRVTFPLEPPVPVKVTAPEPPEVVMPPPMLMALAALLLLTVALKPPSGVVAPTVDAKVIDPPDPDTTLSPCTPAAVAFTVPEKVTLTFEVMTELPDRVTAVGKLMPEVVVVMLLAIVLLLGVVKLNVPTVIAPVVVKVPVFVTLSDVVASALVIVPTLTAPVPAEMETVVPVAREEGPMVAMAPAPVPVVIVSAVEAAVVNVPVEKVIALFVAVKATVPLTLMALPDAAV